MASSMNSTSGQTEEYPIECVESHRDGQEEIEYQIKWEKCEDRTWEPRSQFVNGDDVLASYWLKYFSSSSDPLFESGKYFLELGPLYKALALRAARGKAVVKDIEQAYLRLIKTPSKVLVARRPLVKHFQANVDKIERQLRNLKSKGSESKGKRRKLASSTEENTNLVEERREETEEFRDAPQDDLESANLEGNPKDTESTDTEVEAEMKDDEINEDEVQPPAVDLKETQVTDAEVEAEMNDDEDKVQPPTTDLVCKRASGRLAAIKKTAVIDSEADEEEEDDDVEDDEKIYKPAGNFVCQHGNCQKSFGTKKGLRDHFRYHRALKCGEAGCFWIGAVKKFNEHIRRAHAASSSVEGIKAVRKRAGLDGP